MHASVVIYRPIVAKIVDNGVFEIFPTGDKSVIVDKKVNINKKSLYDLHYVGF